MDTCRPNVTYRDILVQDLPVYLFIVRINLFSHNFLCFEMGNYSFPTPVILGKFHEPLLVIVIRCIS